MVKMTVSYQGEKSCTLTHEPSKVKITTDAPLDNHGRGTSFSPTDLCTSSLASCMLTVMSIHAEKSQLQLKGAFAEVEKHMTPQPPRKIQKIKVDLHLPQALTNDWRSQLENIAQTCPVKLSLHPDIQVDLKFIYDL